MNNKKKYSASFTAGGLLNSETLALLPYLLDDSNVNFSGLIKDSSILQINSESARSRITREIQKRYNTVGKEAFELLKSAKEGEQKIILLYICLKTYRLLFDFVFDIVIVKWLKRDIEITSDDSHYFLDIQSTQHTEINDWSDKTINKISSVMIKILKEGELLQNGKLTQLDAPNHFWKQFVGLGEVWFLQACLLNKAKREEIING